MKQRIQGMILGCVLTVLLLGTVTVVASTTRTIEVTYGVNVVVDGVRQNFAEDSRPFVSGGRTFLPLRAIGDALGMDVRWHRETSTVYLETPAATVGIGETTPTPTPAPTPTPVVRRSYLEVDIWGRNYWVRINRHPYRGTFEMGGTTFLTGISQNNSYDWNYFYDLTDRTYTTLTGTVGMVYGNGGGSILITADGRPVEHITIEPGAPLRVVTVTFPPDTREFRIRFEPSSGTRLGIGNAFFS